MLLASASAGCAVAPIADLEAEADKLRDAAMKDFEAGDRGSALTHNRKALDVTRHLLPTSWRTVENYDDAGLYYYAGENWEQSARHQAIAVLLACGTRESTEMFAAYVARLGWAFAKHRPREDFGPISRNPLLLLEDPALRLRDNADIRRRYFIRYAAPAASRSAQPWYVFRLRADAPRACASQANHL